MREVAEMKKAPARLRRGLWTSVWLKLSALGVFLLFC
jgi:hypothetical protein